MGWNYADLFVNASLDMGESTPMVGKGTPIVWENSTTLPCTSFGSATPYETHETAFEAALDQLMAAAQVLFQRLRMMQSYGGRMAIASAF